MQKRNSREMRRRQIHPAVCIAACFAVIVGVSFAMPGIVGDSNLVLLQALNCGNCFGGSTALGYIGDQGFLSLACA